MEQQDDEAADAGAFEFTGTWQDFAPIAFTNLLLTIVTLGIYSFWAKTRERRYLWSRTRFIDERLEWTGTGLELFIGYLIVIALFFLPLVALQFGIQALVIRGHNGIAAVLGVIAYLLILYLVGVAIFRALRYRLSRTYWHGIRGGSDDQGFAFAGQYVWRTILGFFAAGLMVPWSMTTLWNRRWSAMSFGPFRFEAKADWNRIIGRYLLIYVAVIVLIVVMVGGLAASFALGADRTAEEARGAMGIPLLLAFLGFYILVPLVAVAYYAAYFREAVGKLSLGELGFSFEARTKDWLLLFLGNLALVIFTLGIGYIFIGYRNWSFFVRHMRGYGELHLDELTQSMTRTPRQGEGLLDAFDVGAI